MLIQTEISLSSLISLFSNCVGEFSAESVIFKPMVKLYSISQVLRKDTTTYGKGGKPIALVIEGLQFGGTFFNPEKMCRLNIFVTCVVFFCF